MPRLEDPESSQAVEKDDYVVRGPADDRRQCRQGQSNEENSPDLVVSVAVRVSDGRIEQGSAVSRRQ